MKLYVIKGDHNGKRKPLAFVGTQKDAKAVSAAIQNLEECSDIEWKSLEVPVDKPGLLKWLNKQTVLKIGA